MNDDSCGTRAISRRVPAILCQREGNKWGIIRRHLAYVQQGSESIRFLRVACTTRSPPSSAYSWGFREQCFSLLLLCSIISKRGGIFETTRYYYIFFFFNEFGFSSWRSKVVLQFTSKESFISGD